MVQYQDVKYLPLHQISVNMRQMINKGCAAIHTCSACYVIYKQFLKTKYTINELFLKVSYVMKMTAFPLYIGLILFVMAAAMQCYWRYSMILYNKLSQSKCRQCTKPDISPHHCFLCFLSTTPLLPPFCAPPGLPPISRSPVSSGRAKGQRDNHCSNSNPYISHQYCRSTLNNLLLA